MQINKELQEADAQKIIIIQNDAITREIDKSEQQNLKDEQNQTLNKKHDSIPQQKQNLQALAQSQQFMNQLKQKLAARQVDCNEESISAEIKNDQIPQDVILQQEIIKPIQLEQDEQQKEQNDLDQQQEKSQKSLLSSNSYDYLSRRDNLYNIPSQMQLSIKQSQNILQSTYKAVIIDSGSEEDNDNQQEEEQNDQIDSQIGQDLQQSIKQLSTFNYKNIINESIQQQEKKQLKLQQEPQILPLQIQNDIENDVSLLKQEIAEQQTSNLQQQGLEQEISEAIDKNNTDQNINSSGQYNINKLEDKTAEIQQIIQTPEQKIYGNPLANSDEYDEQEKVLVESIEKQSQQEQQPEPLFRQQTSFQLLVSKRTLGEVEITLAESDGDDDQSEQQDIVSSNIQFDELQDTKINKSNYLLMSVRTRSKQLELEQKQYQNAEIHKSIRMTTQEMKYSSQVIFMNKSQMPVLVRQDAYFYQQLKKIIMIQRFFRNKLFKKRFKIMMKRSRHRQFVIKEIIDTEDRYVQDLAIVINYIMKPMSKFVNQFDMKKIFNNIQTIHTFNQIILSTLQGAFQDKQKDIMGKIIPYLDGFKVYYDYCNEFKQSSKTIEQYEKDKQYATLMQQLRKSNVLRGLDIHSFLVKPVQRLPKYVLLYKDLLKHTETFHLDYENIVKCLKKFEIINNDNNEKMSKQLGQLKTFELHNLYCGYVQIAEANREFIFEETCQLYHDKQDIPIILYAFNNLLLLTKSGECNYKYQNHLVISSFTKVYEKEDNQFKQNLLEILSYNQCLVFTFDKDEQRKELKIKLEKIIQQLFERDQIRQLKSDKQQKQQIRVDVKGTDIRNPSSIKRYTVYITLITIDQIQLKIFVRYSQIQELEKLVRQFDKELQPPHLSSSNWLNNQDPKLLNDRMIVIQQFLQLVLNSKKIMNDEQYQRKVLKLLSIDENFYDLPDKLKNTNRQSLNHSQVMQNIMQSKFTSVKSNQQEVLASRKGTILLENLNQMENRSTFYEVANENSIEFGEQAQLCEHKWHVDLADGQRIEFGFKSSTRSFELVNKVAQHLCLTSCVDFRLFLGDSFQDCTLVDQDEPLSQFHNQQNQPQPRGSVKGLFQTVTKYLKTVTEKNLYLKKFLFLQPGQELADFKSGDFKQQIQRMRLISYQVFDEINKDKYLLSKFEYFLVCAYYNIIKEYDYNIYKGQGIKENYQKIIPPHILKLQSDFVWFENIQLQIEQIKKQIHKLCVLDEMKQSQYTEKLPLALQQFLSFIMTKQLFGTTLYYVDVSQQVLKTFHDKLSVTIYANMYLGINHRGLNLINSSKVIVQSYDFDAISDVKCYALQIDMKLHDIKVNFGTNMAFEIKSLLQEYQSIHRLTNILVQ
ncbi:hypothetical protein pb186bvf_017230 [Paramecium bursaria]